MRVLVVEDDGELTEAIAAGLRLDGMAVDTALDGDAALYHALVNDYDVIVLDRDLPGVHGDEVCAALAGTIRARILLLTAAGTIADRVAGLGRGADDYLPKPFAFAELIARIRALGRRSYPAVPPVLPGVAPGVPRVAPVVAPSAATRPPASAAEELVELERRYAVLDQLDYFEVMGLESTASPADVKRAFHHQSRTFHPDRYFQSPDAHLREQVHAVYKRVTEAYFVLRDDARRKKYLADISGPERLHKLRFDELAEAETKAAVKKEVAEQIGTHPKGRQFFQVGVADLEAGRLSSAERNIKLALTYEPTNPLYLQKLEETRAKSYEAYKRSGRGFRIE